MKCFRPKKEGRLLLCFLLLWGCSAVKTGLPTQGSLEKPSPTKFAHIWQVVEEIAKEQEWPLQKDSQQRGVLQTEWMLLSTDFQQDSLTTTGVDTYSVCPPPTGGIFYNGKEIQVTITVQLVENLQGKIPVQIESRFRSAVYFVGNSLFLGMVECDSTGKLEQALGQIIRERVSS